MMYVIILHSRYTGDPIHLGNKYESREAAERYADKEVCKNCNSYEVVAVPDDWLWINRHDGFRPRLMA